ncbi:hypothetical protein [Tessaracoccus massiliensis]|uniref:hypothetical protein n=1 Tax=Tessaracoccus massiliensis TaxID=1522311 RepID=UPI00058CEBBB|nr:hypothetical protein [Tessaracoccus massiliensis]
MLTRLNTAIDALYSTLLTHSTELHACNGPVPRAVVDELVAAAEAVVDAARGDVLARADEPTLPLEHVAHSLGLTQAAVVAAVAEALALADTWDDEPDDEPSRT